MEANLLLHVREHPHGRVIVTPVEFAGESVDADTYEAALAAVTSRLAQSLRSVSGSVRSRLAEPAVAELDTVELSLTKRARGEKLKITMGLVVKITEASTGLLFVVHAPEVPQFSVAVADRESVAEVSRRELVSTLKHWDLEDILASDEVGEVRLETLTLPFPPVDEPHLTGATTSSRSKRRATSSRCAPPRTGLAGSTAGTRSWNASWPRSHHQAAAA